MTNIDSYVDDVIAALDLEDAPLDRTRVANVSNDIVLDGLRSATLAYLSNPAAFSTNVRLLDGDFEIPRDRWTYSRMGHGQVIHTELINDYIDRAIIDGNLLVIDSIDECDPLIMRLREALEYRLGARAWINVYVTCATQTNFGLHSDTHDTIIIQLFGRKVWHVDRGAQDVPSGMTLEDLDRHELEVPRVLAMAGNTAHNVVGLGELSLHLTIGFDRDTGLSYRLRQIDHLLGRASAPVSKDEVAFGQAMTPDRRTGSSLPFSATHNLADCRFVRWASRLRPLVTETDEGLVSVTSAGTQHTYAPQFAGAVKALVAGGEFSVQELLALTGMAVDQLRKFLLDGVAAGTLICRI